MAATHFSRSRSPVISIRTQPEQEDTLRAEIEAATRTQHEILPRYSWHSAFMKRNSGSALGRAYTQVIQKDNSVDQSNQLLRTQTESNVDGSVFSSVATLRNPPVLKRTQETKKGWKQLTKRLTRKHRRELNLEEDTIHESLEEDERGRKKSAYISRWADEVVVDQDRAAQHAQFNAWLEERMEEQNTVSDLRQPLSPKTRRTIRKSVYGSLSSSKSFFRDHPKKSLERLYSHTSSIAPVTPHVYSFETKDQLRDYLNSGLSTHSPLSPTTQTPFMPATSKSLLPVELSAGPVLAELEGNAPTTTAQESVLSSRTSTPSVRDLPPYIEDKRFRTDIAKEQDCHSIEHSSHLDRVIGSLPEKPYSCHSCHEVVPSHDIYDFCSICDSRDRVLCIRCAAKGSCCQHELEQVFRTCGTTRVDPKSTDLPPKIEEDKQIEDARPCASSTCQAVHRNSNLTEQGCDPATISSLSGKTSGRDVVQTELLKELNHLRREQDLVKREHEISIRAREIEVRDQQTSLREREAIVQHKSDMLLRNLENLLSYQQLAKSAFVGAQFQSQRKPSDVEEPLSEGHVSSGDEPGKSSVFVFDSVRRRRRHRDKLCRVVADTEASLLGLNNQDSHIKSCAAQKRKKDSTGTSTTSPPASTSSPEQSRHPLSRGNSERDGSQDEEDDGDSRRSPKKHKQEPSTPVGPQVLFACPYAKNNPTRFSSRNTVEKNYRGCGTHYLPDVSRLKQHLKRVHWQPEKCCPRCYEEFDKSTELAEHASATVACKSRDCPFPEKMDKTQQEKVHMKRPRVQPETVWYDIYKVLFPGQSLPESPYTEADDKLPTPISATPQSSVNTQATRTLITDFKRRLDQCEELQHSPLRATIEQALGDSFKELLSTYVLSPTSSPGAAPSIIVSPVSRSSSDTTRQFVSPVLPSSSRTSKLERQRSVTQVISQPQQVPLLQHPRPPRPKVNTALQVPLDHHRSPASLGRRESQGDSSSIDGPFNLNLTPHVLEDPGYGDECNSFEPGDDKAAMAFVNGQALPSSRHRSVMSIDSGYGSGKQRPNITPQKSTSLSSTAVGQVCHDRDFGAIQSDCTAEGQNSTIQQGPKTTGLVNGLNVDQADHSMGHFSYSNYLDVYSQEDILNGMDYSFDEPNPWAPQ